MLRATVGIVLTALTTAIWADGTAESGSGGGSGGGRVPATMTWRDEALRPQFHFTAEKNWLNDPNGLVFQDGEYHLFFQHNPTGNQWGNMTWGHAVSPDLLHWRQLANAIEPDERGTIYSGSAVIDWHNTTGFGKNGKPALVTIYTIAGDQAPDKSHPYVQALAWSDDRGRTLHQYEGNPVLEQLAPGNRDPKVIWHEPSQRWIMTLYLAGNRFGFFASPDLKQWTPLQEFEVPGVTECPDFFPLPIEGRPGETRWVWTAANGRYTYGQFDGNSFLPEVIGTLQVEFGRHDYAVQTYSDLPDGRRIQIAWMAGGEYPGMPFNQQMSIPCELTLRPTPAGVRLFKNPVREVETLRAGKQAWQDVALAPGETRPLEGVTGDLLEILAEIEPGKAEQVGLVVRGEKIVWRAKDRTLSALGAVAPLELENGRLRLRLLLDRASLEVFANDGLVALSSCFVPTSEPAYALFAQGDSARFPLVQCHALKSVWTAAKP